MGLFDVVLISIVPVIIIGAAVYLKQRQKKHRDS
jgi:hypothetical protein